MPGGTSADAIASFQRDAAAIAARSQYGWGHTIDFGPFVQDGLFGRHYLITTGLFDAWQWWPGRLDGLQVADIGCFSGGISALMAARGARRVLAVDEVPEHAEQCALVAKAFGLDAIQVETRSLYALDDRVVEPGSLDYIVMAGVLYHLSDMLVGLHMLRRMLRPGGWLFMETAAVQEFEHSYANFSRFIGGGWWEPTALCIQDMLQFMSYDQVEIRFYCEDRCMVRARNAGGDPPFRRGLNWKFDSLKDRQPRSMDAAGLARAPRRAGSAPAPAKPVEPE